MNAIRQSARDLLTAIARQAMLDQGLLADFSPEAQAQAGALTRSAADPHARDLRGAQWVSIDNDDSRDLDQLSVAESLTGSSTRLLVAIADVDAAVNRGSPIDDHARQNTTSRTAASPAPPFIAPRSSIRPSWRTTAWQVGLKTARLRPRHSKPPDCRIKCASRTRWRNRWVGSGTRKVH